MPFAARRRRLFDIFDGAAGDPGGAGAANARAAAEDRRQPDRFGKFEQTALVARPRRGDPRFGETDRHRAVARLPIRGRTSSLSSGYSAVPEPNDL